MGPLKRYLSKRSIFVFLKQKLCFHKYMIINILLFLKQKKIFGFVTAGEIISVIVFPSKTK